MSSEPKKAKHIEEAKPADTIQIGNKVFEFKHTAVNKDIHMFIGSSDSSVRSHNPKLCPECIEPGSLSEATALSHIRTQTCGTAPCDNPDHEYKPALSDHQDRITICSECGEPFYKRENGKIAGFHNHKRGDSVSGSTLNSVGLAAGEKANSIPQSLEQQPLTDKDPCPVCKHLVADHAFPLACLKCGLDCDRHPQALSSPTSSDRHEDTKPKVDQGQSVNDEQSLLKYVYALGWNNALNPTNDDREDWSGSIAKLEQLISRRIVEELKAIRKKTYWGDGSPDDLDQRIKELSDEETLIKLLKEPEE